MESLRLFPFAVLLLALAGSSGCKKHASETNNSITFDSIKENIIYHLYNDTTKPYCQLQINFMYPADCPDTSLLKSLQSIFIAKYFGNSLSDETPQNALRMYKKQYIENYRQFEHDEDGNTPEYSFGHHVYDARSSYSYYEFSHNDIFFNHNDILSFVIHIENYTGGAHGSHRLTACTIDLNTGRVLDENDIFCENYSDAIAAAIVQKIVEANKLSNPRELENVGYFDIREIVPNGNFLVNNEGITYIFNEYDIAPYFLGKTEVLLPYDEIDLYINKQGPLAKLIY